jgi:hypothetical protein
LAVNGGTSPYQYLWGNSSTTNTLSSLAAGSYPFTITDQNGCTVSSIAVVANNPEPINPNVTTTQYPTCTQSNGATAVWPFGGTAPYTYSWNTGVTRNYITNVTSGIYSVTITDAMGCSLVAYDTLELGNGDGLFVAAYTTPSPCGQAGGAATAWVSGGFAAYTYAWGTSPVQTADSAIDLAAGNYSLTVTDSKGCSASGTFAISNIGAPSLTLSSTPATGGQDNGTATVSATGSGGYTYSWSTGATTATITNLAATTYYVTVSTNGGCESVGSIIVTSTTGVADVDVPVKLNLYPNPSTGNVFVDVELPETNSVLIEWYDIAGKKLLTDQADNVQHLKKEYNMSAYPDAIYLVRISTGNNSFSKRVVIER